MDDNIPYGFNDDGQSNIRKAYGSSKGFKKYQEQKEAEIIVKRDWFEKSMNAPTLDEADAIMNRIKQNPKAYNFENTTRDNSSTEHDTGDTGL